MNVGCVYLFWVVLQIRFILEIYYCVGNCCKFIDMNVEKCYQIFFCLWEQNLNLIIELDYFSIFELLILVVLLVQVMDVSVNKVMVKFYLVVNMSEVIYVLGVEGLIFYIKIIGLFNSKVVNVIKICKILMDQYYSEVFVNWDVLEFLFGVGRKIVNVVLNMVFGQLVMVVDIYIFRVFNCICIVFGKNVLEVEKKFMWMVLKEFLLDVYYWLILYGCYVCIVCKFCCGVCIIEDLCEFKDKIEYD